MSRLLSELLQAPEPFFRTALRDLETHHGQPNHDIRLSTELLQQTQAKIRELGLDPRDTTPEELYHVLQTRLQHDDAKLVRHLRVRAATFVSAEGDVAAGMLHLLQSLPESRRVFALKGSTLRALLKKQPPTKTIKRLGYRSLASFLKHETPVSMLAAAWLVESAQWQKRFQEQYKRLRPSDFENRDLTIVAADFKSWKGLADAAVAERKHTILSFKELGALVLLPLPDHAPQGSVTASLVLALQELNELQAAGTFLKLSQVRGDFGTIVQHVAADEPQLSTSILNQPLSWSLIQRFYNRLSQEVRETVFEPHIELEDMAWRPIEATLAKLQPSLAFWQGSSHLGVMHGQRPVSFNLADAALNFCNQLPFEQRLTHYFQRSLWHELLLRYLQHEQVEQSVAAQLQPALAAATAEV